jgi:hypothetical protein
MNILRIGIIMILWLTMGYITIAESNDILFVTGDFVNIRAQPSLNAKVRWQAHWGTKFSGKQVSQDWFEVETFLGEKQYISARYVAPPLIFYQKAEQKSDKNGRTKYELTLYYKELGEIEKAENFSLDIINHHARETLPTGYESCDILGRLAYQAVRGNDYSDPYILDYTMRVIPQSHEPLLTAYALLDQAKYFIRGDDLEHAEELIWRIITDYSEDLLVPVQCRLDMESLIALLWDVKSLFFVVQTLKDPSEKEQQELWRQLDDLSKNHHSAATRAIARDLRRKGNGYWWEYEEYLDGLPAEKKQ